MERYLTNLRVWAWEYPDSPGRYRGVHLTANRTACDALIRCLDTLAADAGGHRTIPLRPLDPADEAEILGGRPYRSFRDMRLDWMLGSLDRQSEHLKFWPCFGHLFVTRPDIEE